MTFSLDVDLWSIQTVPAQDATSRAADMAGRGDDFAARLMADRGELPDLFAPDTPLAGDTSALAYAALSLPEPQVEPPRVIPMAPPPGETVPLPSPLIYPAGPVPDAGPEPLPEAEPEAGLRAQVPAERAPAPQPVPEAAADAADVKIMAMATQMPAPVVPAAAAPIAAPDAEAPLIIAAAGEARRMAEPVRTLSDSVEAPKAALHDKAMPLPAAPVAAPAPEIPADAGLPRPDAPRAEDTASALTALAARADGDMPATPAAQTATPVPLAAAPGAPSPFLQASAPAQVQAAFTPAHAVLVATTAEIPALVGRASAENGNERLTVQLDPPELGRVSIDFKFDAQGLQHVTVTAETPEAMRQLRAMHFELLQALERSGFSGQEMSFQQGASQQQQQQAGQSQPARSLATAAAAASAALPSSVSAPDRHLAGSGRLDIKL